MIEAESKLTFARSGALQATAKPPEAARKPHHYSHHGVTIKDDWQWLRDPEYPQVRSASILDYLNAENDYFDQVIAPHKAFVNELFDELKARQPDEDESVPFRDGDFFYQWRFAKDAQYRSWWRKTACAADSPWTGFLDEAALAKNVSNFVLGGWCPSPDGRYLAWSADDAGAERFTIRIKDLHTGSLLDTCIADTMGTPFWSSDSCTLLYVALDKHWRPYQVKAHHPHLPSTPDQVLYEEKTNGFWVGLSSTQSREWFVIDAHDHETSELYLISTREPLNPPTRLSPRRFRHQYDLDHAHGRFWIRTNDQHKNFRLVSTPDSQPEEANWREEVAPTDANHLLAVHSFQDFYVLRERYAGLTRIRICDYQSANEHSISWPEPVYEVSFGENRCFQTSKLRLRYASLITPATWFDYEVSSRKLHKLKEQSIPSGYDASLYQCERLEATARDGTKVPVSLVYRKDLQKDSSHLLYLYAYGAYGHVVAPDFKLSWLSLLERGFVCAIAHIRGGADLGYSWYESGKLLQRTHTFEDFVDVAKHCISAGYSAPGRIAIAGGSAGGQLMGVVVNQAPDLWGAVVAHVPFVDTLNTMLDETLPLTPMEWPEWGNPATDPVVFEYMRAYSPYDQSRIADYPPMLVTGGLNDPRVTYWEPAKWVAKIRHLKQDNNMLLLKTAMSAGHQGQTGRYDALYEQAEAWAFILLTMGEKIGEKMGEKPHANKKHAEALSRKSKEYESQRGAG